MAIKAELTQRQSLHQSLMLTPQMRQSIYLLQLPILELKNCIEQELTENPALEIEEKQEEPIPTSEIEAETNSEENTNEENNNELEMKENFEKLNALNEDWDNYFGQDENIPLRNVSEQQELKNYLETTITKETNLQDHLTEHLQLFDFNEQELQIAEFIIGNIDDNGYLRIALKELSIAFNVSEEIIRNILDEFLYLDPPGIGALCLKECLLAQLNVMMKSEKVLNAIIIIEKYLELLEKNKISQIASKLKLSLKQLHPVIELIKSLDPKPGKRFMSDTTQYIVPDITIKKIEDKYTIFVNDEQLPSLKINNFYKQLINNKDTEEEAKKYIKEKVQSGLWLLKAIQQREKTIHRIAEFLLEHQEKFFTHGINFLKPLILKDAAEALELHESTISRTIMNKYVETPQGIFALKYFFTSGLENDKGKMISSKNIQSKISSLIKNENPKKPLSDQKLSNIITKQGIKIARRTVTKYRKELNIVSTSQRKNIL